jgi:hypothetical protein
MSNRSRAHAACCEVWHQGAMEPSRAYALLREDGGSQTLVFVHEADTAADCEKVVEAHNRLVRCAAAVEEIAEVLGPAATVCSGCSAEIAEALRIINQAIEPTAGETNVSDQAEGTAPAVLDVWPFDRLAGRGMHELRDDELPGYLVSVAARTGALSTEFAEAARWVASELARKRNDEGVLATRLEGVRAERDAAQYELERERIRLAACGVVANANTPESAARARDMHPDFRSASCDDVARCVDECMRLNLEARDLREERDILQESSDKLMQDAVRWLWARSYLIAMTFVSGLHDSATETHSPCGAANTRDYWDCVADRAITMRTERTAK